MGTFAGYYGDMTVPEEERDEFTRRMIYLLGQGGMMCIEHVQIFGKEINLLAPLVPDKDDWIVFRYNYFEDDAWEPAAYNIRTAKFSSEKIGSQQFCVVICAAYVLYEFYTKEFGIAELDGMIYRGNPFIGWLNYLFDEKYTNARMKDPYQIYCLRPDRFGDKILLDYVFSSDGECVSSAGLFRYLEAGLPEDSEDRETFKESIKKAEKLDAERPPYPPVEKLSTRDFLDCKGFSDDDRAYFWKLDGDVHFSPEMKEWMEQLRAEFREIESHPKQLSVGTDFLKMLMETLIDANKAFRWIYMFQSTFYDFISHPEDPKRQAAVVLLQRLIERGKAELPPPHPDSWVAWHEKRFSPARQRVKRYLAILGNPELRKEILGF